MTQTKRTHVTFRWRSDEQRRAARIAAAHADMSINEWLLTLVDRALRSPSGRPE